MMDVKTLNYWIHQIYFGNTDLEVILDFGDLIH